MSTGIAIRRECFTDMPRLYEHLQTVGVLTVQMVERTHLEGFLASLDHYALTASTRRRKVAAIRSFFAFLEQAGHRIGNPAGKLVPPEGNGSSRGISRNRSTSASFMKHEVNPAMSPSSSSSGQL